MEGISEHTLLINKMIGLTKKLEDWPSTLNELGFRLDLIEPTFNVADEDDSAIRPDLFLSSNKLTHSLIVECKSGKTLDNHSKKQLRKYSMVEPKDVLQWAKIYDPKKLTVEVCFAINHSNKILVKAINDKHSFPILVFSDKKIHKENDFSNIPLNKAFSSEIHLADYPPISFYPFSDDREDSLISLYVFRELVGLALKQNYQEEIEIKIDDLLNSIHPCWDSIHDKKKTEIAKRVKEVLKEYMPALKDHLSIIGDGRKVSLKIMSIQAFSRKCNEIIKELATQRKIDQY